MDNDFARDDATREQLRCCLPGYQALTRDPGAVPIDATKPLGQVADATILAASRLET